MNATTKRFGSVGVLFFLLFTGVASAASNDLRLIEAVKRDDKVAVRSLLQQKVDVNAAEADGATALAWAAHLDAVDTAELLIRVGARLNVANRYGATPIWLASASASAAMVETLLKAGADPNTMLPTGETPLMAAARAGQVESVKLLLAYGAKIEAKENQRGQNALMWAAAQRHPEVVRALIEHGADIHSRSNGGYTPFLFSAQQGDIDSAKFFLAAGADVNEASPKDGSALVLASAGGHEAFALFLLDHGANPNAADDSGVTALHYAIRKGLSNIYTVHYDTAMPDVTRPNMMGLVKALLAHGADPNARVTKNPRLPGSRNVSTIAGVIGATPFMMAAASHDAELMRVLLAAGADPKLVAEKNTTPLMVAAGLTEGLGYWEPRTAEEDRKSLEAVRLVIELGADVNAATKSGDTALHGAAYVGCVSVIQYLVDKGARLDAKDMWGQTPLIIAQRIFTPALTNGGNLSNNIRPAFVHQEAADLLLKLGATPITQEQLDASASVGSSR